MTGEPVPDRAATARSASRGRVAGRALRADALRNREQLIGAAAQIFGERGYDAALEEVARRAGVGIGTLYRRFPNREALVVAVVHGALHAVVSRLESAADHGPAWNGLVEAIGYSREIQLSLQPLGPMPESLRQAVAADPEIRTLRVAFVDEVTRLVERAQQDGDLRSDVGPGDVLNLMSLFYRNQPTRSQSEDVGKRAIALLLDGLATGDRGELPGQPVAATDL